MKLQEYINEMKPDFHRLYGEKYQFQPAQSEAHMDLTLNACTQYLQKLAMSGKVSELQQLATGGGSALAASSYYQELIATCTQSYYGLNWEQSRKEELAKEILAFILDGLKFRYQSGGYPPNTQGMLQFLGLDSGIMGKMGGLFGRFFK